MEQLIILSKLEQEYLLHALEAAVRIDEPGQFFLWSQGQLQALLPHQMLVCLQFDAEQQLQYHSCLHSRVFDAALRGRLAGAEDGLAVRLARHCRQGAGRGMLPAMLDTARPASDAALAALQAEARRLGFDNVLLHGTEPLAGGASFFALFGLPHRLRGRDAYFLELLLPTLHLSLQRVARRAASAPAEAGLRPLSAREAQILHWLREGKSNDEIGQILGISGLTVKNHLQRLYRVLGVSNRAHAVARCMALRLLAPPPSIARAA
ncbi:LuxR C-terminal-related transcriptional regulator [Rugamonas sp. CCM 8940]|uniref:LuxR C-terminal-related transcriptional regulator n=1 Tax=Rugamonas sp. CCM 8940 TaxID=2765359 RepID=UPI0018F2E108|nr:LuxR C-terminal-related transcriptional regulator [Rugamonas sp. CCM 8940]MBJ7311429.1 helix-turn-helix transcriptional regulator [Rugamonas sp. CCM 8940]